MAGGGKMNRVVPTICMFLYSFEIGGSEILGLRLIKHYQDAGLNVVCCATRKSAGPLVSAIQELEVPCLALNLEGGSRFSRILKKLNLFRWLRKYQVNCLHAQHFCVYADVQRLAALAGVSHQIVTEHTAEPLANDAKFARTVSKLAHSAASVVAINETVREAICRVSNFDSTQVEVIENGVDTDRFIPVEKEKRSIIKVVWLARLHPDKDVLTGLRAFREAATSRDVNLMFRIIGDGEDREVAQQFVLENNLTDQVIFEGALANPLEILQDSDVFLMSSLTEGTPLALLEAMSCGLPVVATAVGGIPLTVSDDIGLLSPAGDSGKLASNLLILARDEKRRHEMGALARELVLSRFSEKKMANDYLGLLFQQS